MNKIFVVAGTFDEFRRFRLWLMREMESNGESLDLQKVVNIVDTATLRGYNNVWGYKVGTWRNRKDIQEIELFLKTRCSSLEEDFIEVDL